VASLTKIQGGTLTLAIGYYYFPVYGGRYWFTGPVQTIKDIEVEPESTDVKGEAESEKNSTEKGD